MNQADYSQIQLSESALDKPELMKEGEVVTIQINTEDDMPLSVDLPATVILEITATEPSVLTEEVSFELETDVVPSGPQKVNPIKEKKLYDVVLLASCLETIALSWSTYNWEFSATVPWLIIFPLLIASFVSVFLLIYRP